MNLLSNVTTRLFYEIANAFFWPIAIALICSLAFALADFGALCVQLWRKRHEKQTDLSGVARAIAVGSGGLDLCEHDVLSGVTLSPALSRFWALLCGRLAELGSGANLDIWLEETLEREELRITARLDRSRALVRLGPMLGLAGTIIPLGPALESLLAGDMAGMVDHLVIGFGAVVCGLVLSGISYVITLVRERWARGELKEMENVCELILRARGKDNAERQLPIEEKFLASV